MRFYFTIIVIVASCITIFTITLFDINVQDSICSPRHIQTGGAAQNVCIGKYFVTKSPKSCKNFDFKCKWAMIKQIYTYKNWYEYYNHLKITGNITSFSYDHVIMNKESHFHAIKPNRTCNQIRMRELELELQWNNQFIADAYPLSNVFLDETGCVKMIDFNIFPNIVKPIAIKTGMKFLGDYPSISSGGGRHYIEKHWL